MEMYADVESRAGVLEAEGVVEIRLRREKLLTLMERLDREYAQLKRDSLDSTKSPEERAAAKDKLGLREQELAPTYKQVALSYADLHDRVGRMHAKGCAEPVVWTEARRFFYWRLRAKLLLSALVDKLLEADPNLTEEECQQVLQSALPNVNFGDTRQTVEGLEHFDSTNMVNKVKEMTVARRIRELASTSPSGALTGVLSLLHNLSPTERQRVLAELQAPSDNTSPPSYSQPA